MQKIWNVHVMNVNTLKRRGKVKRQRFVEGKRADQKRAVVTLAQGDQIEIFETR
jgi:large subunit ribosomal protein L23